MMKPTKHMKGLAMVEFTIILPILLFLLFSILELGRAFFLYTELEKLSRDSTRYLAHVIGGGTGSYALTQDLIDKTSNLAVYGNASGGSDTLLPSLSIDQVSVTLYGNHVLVEITYPFQPVLSQLPDFFSGDAISLNFNMTSSYTMRVQ
ncbi:pilus assembly protein [Photobacterium sagamiensis]|uniref:TadE/TadG family type IV pilus assembly protein n=1 Tax=Photobacterium sagamiensis TaxID=2910241 RepID=UPI003D0B0EB4